MKQYAVFRAPGYRACLLPPLHPRTSNFLPVPMKLLRRVGVVVNRPPWFLPTFMKADERAGGLPVVSDGG